MNWEGCQVNTYLSPAFQNKSKGLNLQGLYRTGKHTGLRVILVPAVLCYETCNLEQAPNSSFSSYNGIRCGGRGRWTPGFISGFSLTLYLSYFPYLFFLFFFFLALPVACRSSQARDWTHATAVTRPNPSRGHQGTPTIFSKLVKEGLLK